MLADGTVSPKLLAHGFIDLEGDVMSGLIALEANANCGPLVGMEFLRKAKKMLLLGRGGVMLLDEAPAMTHSANPPEDESAQPDRD